MKKTLNILCLLFLLRITFVYGQVTGMKFAPDSTRWSMEWKYATGFTTYNQGYENFQIKGDTIINNNKYCQKLFASNSKNFDTSCLQYNTYLYYENKKLYIDTVLFYDFNLNAGDTFNLYVSDLIGHNGYYSMPVDSVDSMYYGNKWRKKIIFHKMSGFYFSALKWVEGIGDIYYGFNGNNDYYGEVNQYISDVGYSRLNCFQETGYATYGNYCYNGSCTTGVNEINEVSGIFIYPNPTTDKIYIETLNNDVMEASLFDIVGKKVSDTKCKSIKTNIDVSDFKKGIYLLQIKNQQGIIVKKIIIN